VDELRSQRTMQPRTAAPKRLARCLPMPPVILIEPLTTTNPARPLAARWMSKVRYIQL
jgi:hypothetical protein